MGKVKDAIKAVTFRGKPLLVKLMSSDEITKTEMEGFVEAVTNFKIAAQNWKAKGKKTNLFGLKSKEKQIDGTIIYADEIMKIIYVYMSKNQL